RLYTKNEQAYIERFNRTVCKECLGGGTYRATDLAHVTLQADAFFACDHYHRPHVEFSSMRPTLQTPTTQEDGLSDFYGNATP
ncbi:MAG: hypothetical protein ABI604_10815, partial [Nitrospirota bacterium]